MLLNVTATNASWMTIALSIISSGAFSYLVTLFTANRVKKNEFEWDYKKYILEKRKLAYETLNTVAQKIFEVMIAPDGSEYFLITTQHQKEVLALNNELVEIKLHKEWISEEMNKLIADTNRVIVELSSKLKNQTSDLRLRTTELNNIRNVAIRFYKIYWSDIANLHNLDKFFKSKRFV